MLKELEFLSYKVYLVQNWRKLNTTYLILHCIIILQQSTHSIDYSMLFSIISRNPNNPFSKYQPNQTWKQHRRYDHDNLTATISNYFLPFITSHYQVPTGMFIIYSMFKIAQKVARETALKNRFVSWMKLFF